MENRRLFLAAFLSLALVVLWGRFVQPPAVQPPAESFETREPTNGGTGTSTPSTASSEADLDSADSAVPSGEVATAEPSSLADVAALEEQSTEVETAHYRATFSNRGARLVSLKLLDEFTKSGEPIEMVRMRGAADPYPYSTVDAEGRPDALAEALFTLDRTSDGEGATELRFAHRSARGAATKVFRVQSNGMVEVEAAVEGRRDWSLFLGPGVRNPDAEALDNRWLLRMVVLIQGDDEEKLLPDKQDVAVVARVPGLQWTTLEDNYFLNAVVPSSLQAVSVLPVGQREEAEGVRRFAFGGDLVALGDEVTREQALLLSNGGDPVRFLSYFGSKRYDQLVDLNYGFEKTVRWGVFSFVARPMYYGLRWIHDRIPNYGWAIVLMTMLIKVLFFPLTHKSQKSMAKMQEINPQVQALRNRYRPKLKDKQGRPNPEAQRQMNEEMLALYRKSGVNPASGCLPVLIQIPVFFAFFKLLSTSVELRNAPWIGWVHDLSVPDPWYLLPLLMLVTSVLLQRMTPPPPDPMQRRIMQMFPIMFGFFAITFPSGLVLYWLTNNLLSMAQQAYYLKNKNKS